MLAGEVHLHVILSLGRKDRCSDMASNRRHGKQAFEIFSLALAQSHVAGLQHSGCSLEASVAVSFVCAQQKHLWSSGYDVSLTR